MGEVKKKIAKVPRDFEELVALYDHFITVHIYKISKQNVRPDDVEDLKQAVYTRLVEQNCLQKYDPAKGAFSTYLFWVVRSVVVNQFERNTRNPLNHARGTRATRLYSGDSATKHERARVPLDMLPEFQDQDFEHREALSDVVAKLEASAATVKQGAELLDVMRLLYTGHTASEVAAEIGRSSSKVAEYRRRLEALLRTRLKVAPARVAV